MCSVGGFGLARHVTAAGVMITMEALVAHLAMALAKKHTKGQSAQHLTLFYDHQKMEFL